MRQQGRGVFVAAPQSTLPAGRRKNVLIELAQRLLSEASRLGADSDEVVAIVREVAEEMEPTQ